MEKINIAELLKDCPKGMELDCVLYENVTFDIVQDGNAFPIKIDTPEGRISLSKYGCYSLNSQCKCIIFPKGKTTWEGFVPPCMFKDGDIVSVTMHPEGTWIGMFKQYEEKTFESHCSLNTLGRFHNTLKGHSLIGVHLATEEEKQRLFQVIKDNGYKWNEETKTLEKLVPNKFDITTLKPFDKVLSRDNDTQKWSAELFSFYDNKSTDYRFQLVGVVYARYCIPYEGNEHLLGKTDDCDEFYKTGKN